MAKFRQLWFVIVAIVCFVACLVLVYNMVGSKRGHQQRHNDINSFDDCASAGYPVQESFPEVCRVPDGKSFTRPMPPDEPAN